MNYENAARKVTVGFLSAMVVAAPHAKAGCEKFLGYQEARCQDVAGAAQNLHKWFVSTSTATNAL
jgi:hypothetical protein